MLIVQETKPMFWRIEITPEGLQRFETNTNPKKTDLDEMKGITIIKYDPLRDIGKVAGGALFGFVTDEQAAFEWLLKFKRVAGIVECGPLNQDQLARYFKTLWKYEKTNLKITPLPKLVP